MVEIREKNYDNLVYSTRGDIVFPEKQGFFLSSCLRKFLEMLIRTKIKQNNIVQIIVYSAGL